LRATYAAAESIIKDQVGSEREVSLVLGFSRPAFQRWKQSSPGFRAKASSELLPVVMSIFHVYKRRCGSRRIEVELRHRGHSCGRERAEELMKNCRIEGNSATKSFKPRSTESRHSFGYIRNLFLKLAKPARISELWAAGITYIPVLAIASVTCQPNRSIFAKDNWPDTG